MVSFYSYSFTKEALGIKHILAEACYPIIHHVRDMILTQISPLRCTSTAKVSRMTCPFLLGKIAIELMFWGWVTQTVRHHDTLRLRHTKSYVISSGYARRRLLLRVRDKQKATTFFSFVWAIRGFCHCKTTYRRADLVFRKRTKRRLPYATMNIADRVVWLGAPGVSFYCLRLRGRAAVEQITGLYVYVDLLVTKVICETRPMTSGFSCEPLLDLLCKDEIEALSSWMERRYADGV